MENLQVSSTYSSNFVKEYAIDNNVDTFYHSDEHTLTLHLFEVTIASEIRITRVIIVNRIDCCGERIDGAVIQLLQDGNLVKDCGTIEYREDSVTVEGQMYEVWCGDFGDQVRVSLDTGEYLQIAEIKIYFTFEYGTFIPNSYVC